MELVRRTISSSMVHGAGSPPEPPIDTPISSVFLVIFLIVGVCNMFLLQGNRRRGWVFFFNGAMFGFCLIRVASNALRIAWAYHQRHAPLALAANIFVYAGTVILFAVNLFFVQRIFRSRHPRFAWKLKTLNYMPLAGIITIVVTLAMVITVVVQNQYTINPNTQRIDLDVRRYCLTMFLVLAFLPIPLLAIVWLIPRKDPIDHFGSGTYWVKDVLVLLASIDLTLGAAYRAGTSFLTPVPISQPNPWYNSTASFYCFDFLTDLLPLILFLFARVDRRFYTPDRAWGPGSYSLNYTYNSQGERVWPRGNPLGLNGTPHWLEEQRKADLSVSAPSHVSIASERDLDDEEKGVDAAHVKGDNKGEKSKAAPPVIDLDRS